MVSLRSFFTNYLKAFSQGNAKKISPYYSFPLTIVDYSDKVNVTTTIKNKKQFYKYFNNLYEVLINFYGYKKTKIANISVTENKNFGRAKIKALRLDQKNKIFQKLELIYFVKKIKNQYRIICFVV